MAEWHLHLGPAGAGVPTLCAHCADHRVWHPTICSKWSAGIQRVFKKQRLWEKSPPLPSGGAVFNWEDHLVHCSFHSQTHWSDISDQSEPSKEAREALYPGAPSGLGFGLEVKTLPGSVSECFQACLSVFSVVQFKVGVLSLQQSLMEMRLWAVSARAWAEDEVRPPNIQQRSTWIQWAMSVQMSVGDRQTNTASI